MKIITKEATVIENGFISAQNVTVCDHGNTISINSTEHLKEDLVISENEITSKMGNWTVSW